MRPHGRAGLHKATIKRAPALVHIRLPFTDTNTMHPSSHSHVHSCPPIVHTVVQAAAPQCNCSVLEPRWVNACRAVNDLQSLYYNTALGTWKEMDLWHDMLALHATVDFAARATAAGPARTSVDDHSGLRVRDVDAATDSTQTSADRVSRHRVSEVPDQGRGNMRITAVDDSTHPCASVFAPIAERVHATHAISGVMIDPGNGYDDWGWVVAA
jgi:hypothetical protein